MKLIWRQGCSNKGCLAMTRNFEQLQRMIETVARALGDELRGEVAFAGGVITGLLVTDEVTRGDIRITYDVDLIVYVVGHVHWEKFQDQLKSKGFKVRHNEGPICRMYLGNLEVDFMPDDEKILGFSNRWYKQALKQAQDHRLSDGLVIRLLSPPYFVATKLEAYKGRGNGDPMGSHDIEDLLNIVDGRPELMDEIQAADLEVRSYIAEEISALLEQDGIAHAIESLSRRVPERSDIIFERLEAIKALKNQTNDF